MMATSHKTHPASTVLRLERVGSAVIRYGHALISMGAALWTAGESLDAASARKRAR
jgi:hypothetical protein